MQRSHRGVWQRRRIKRRIYHGNFSSRLSNSAILARKRRKHGSHRRNQHHGKLIRYQRSKLAASKGHGMQWQRSFSVSNNISGGKSVMAAAA